MIHVSFNQAHILLVAFEADAGLIWAVILTMFAHSSKDASDSVDGPFKLTNESIELIVSATAG